MDFPFACQQNKLLSTLSTLGIGGPARYYVEVGDIASMQQILMFCSEQALPFFILGKGSNCLFDDAGFDGVVIHNKIGFFENPQAGLFRVGAGYSFSLLGVKTAREGWSGLEFASGIPASVGGAVFMNAGANGWETCDSLLEVEYVDERGQLCVFSREKLEFSYRTSPFQHMSGAIVAASFFLSPLDSARQKQFQILDYRKKTQPYGEKSAGCIFRNPPGGHAGALIEQTGLKGQAIGGAKVSCMHANFIVNEGNARAREVLELIAHIKEEVLKQQGVELESEVRYISSLPKSI
ncbi:UDP-N-acetylmuramate dehydrogenase [Parachlamydia sp. AcF125]|uniref:UDP-N-acetylmuramate dehydrogenase n=1 Tax=Parachlamydia sp. AcF125 TaxID=2795736 RepID=UPI001BC93741|nr:UDP-N-acetylmuramate dehydrogenase [Parachlamydia sp. AcF125]MBS4169209.1 UDP-N-acetylenolpyruvoylglucosamine reductase [Parachlamydia sp. AcF125]